MHPRVHQIINFCRHVNEALVTLTDRDERYVQEVVTRATVIVQRFSKWYNQYFRDHFDEYRRLVDSNASIPTKVLIDWLQEMARTLYTEMQGHYPAFIFKSVLPLDRFDISLARDGYGTSGPPVPTHLQGRIRIDILAFLPVEAFGHGETLRNIDRRFELDLHEIFTHGMIHLKQRLRHPQMRLLGNDQAHSLTRKGMLPPNPDDRPRDPLHGRKDPARILGTPQTSRMIPLAQFLGEPEEIMGWAVGVAKTYSASKEFRNTETGVRKREELAVIVGHILTRLTYGSVPAKRFLRYLIEAFRHYGISRREINHFLVRAKYKAGTP